MKLSSELARVTVQLLTCLCSASHCVQSDPFANEAGLESSTWETPAEVTAAETEIAAALAADAAAAAAEAAAGPKLIIVKAGKCPGTCKTTASGCTGTFKAGLWSVFMQTCACKHAGILTSLFKLTVADALF